jgi:hypothetical protein
MRQGQHSHNHNKRSRGRGRGGRPGGGGSGGGGGGGGNPINRVYESNGPDVKVRGTAQTIAEKYMQLARDAHSSGDTVMVESYNQHAEHYLRILAAAQAYNQQHMPQQHQQQYRRPGEEASDNFEEGGEAESETGGESESQAQPFTPDVTASPPVHQPSDNEQRPQGRRPDDRPRQQFDRTRNGADQPRQARIEDEADGWDGPQPQFLRRPSGPQAQQANGGDRQQQRDRKPMRERGPRPRDEQSSAAPEGTETVPASSDGDGSAAS